MKKYIFFVLIFCFLFLAVLNNSFAKNSFSLIGKTIIIDPGHGFLDPGTTAGDILEKDLNLKISLFLKDFLEQNGAKVLMTREGDYDLSKPNANFRKKSDFDNRINFINTSNADIYLSIHLNYLNDASYSGSQVFYGSKVLAQNITKTLKTERKIKPIPSDVYMYNKLKIPGVLIECGFLSNLNERNKLINEEYQQTLALNIGYGVINYFS